jgi:hypothetical protein
MLIASDLIHLPYTPDLSESGAAYACRWLASSHAQQAGNPAGRLRQIVGEIALELAFRRQLTQQAVPFEVLGMQPFDSPEHFDVTLGGHRCNLHGSMLTRRSQIAELRHEPGRLLQAPALIPLEKFATEGHKPEDVHLFAFIIGIEATRQADMQKALNAGLPVYLIHSLPEAWAQPEKRSALHNVTLKSDCPAAVEVEIGGLDGEHQFISEALELPSRETRRLAKDFHSLAYILSRSRLQARIGIHCHRYGEALIIPARAWDNVWIYGMEIILLGWLTHEQYRSQACMLNTGSQPFPYAARPEKSLLVPVHELNPLGSLLEKVKAWGRENTPHL